MGEMRVDLHHLLEDLRDAYPGSVEETILTEVVANSLDSGARSVDVLVDPSAASVTIVDDGSGMKRRELARYHDLAASTKQRGRGIGFAGVGIKLALLVSSEVVTETRRGASHAATTWQLANRHRAPWKWLSPPPGLLSARGTAVLLRLANPLSPLLDSGFVETTLRRHFEPLLDPRLDEILEGAYPHGIALAVNGAAITRRAAWPAQSAAIAVRLARKRKPAAAGWLARAAAPLGEEVRGVAISTFGKVIKRGWDWLGVSPAHPDLVCGLIEAPALAECLTLNKGDFVRTGSRGAGYLAYRRAIQEAVARQLAAWGEPDGATHELRRAARPVERDLETVLVDLADDFPMLASLVERRLGGQRKLPMGRPGARAAIAELVDAGAAPADTNGAAETAEPPPRDAAPPSSHDAGAASSGGPLRPARYGLAIGFRSRPDDDEIAKLVETTVWVNDAHPAYRRAMLSRSEGYHLALAVALALAPLAAEATAHHAFVTAFLARWGRAVDAARFRQGSRRRGGAAGR